MTDLRDMIDELEELRKENEAFERLATNLEKDCERLLKQLDIAVKALRGVYVWANTGNGGEQAVKKLCNTTLQQIKELNK